MTLADRLRRAAEHQLALPALMAVLICLTGAHVAISAGIPSWANDEAPHLGYVATLAHGDLPSIDSPIIDGPARFPPGYSSLYGWDDAHRDVWTANHPPLYHLVLVPVWWLAGCDLAHTVIAMRLINTLGYGCWVLLVGLIARELVPRRPAAIALATVLTVTPSLALRAGYLQNDGWGCSAALLMMLMTIRMLRGGPGAVTGRRVAVAALAGALAAGTRAPGVLVVAVCCLTLLVCLRRERRGLVAAVVVGAIPLAATGWFYVRNLRLYGDLTGQGALLDKFDRSPLGGWTHILSIPGLWEAGLATWIPLVVTATVVPYVVVHRTVLRARAGTLWSARPDPAWTMLVVLTALTAANLVGFVRTGGGFHDRYLMTSMPLFATVTALAMLRIRRPPLRAVGDQSVRAGRREWRLAATWSAVLLVWLVAAFGYQEWFYVFRGPDHHPVTGPVPVLLLGAAVLVGALVLLVMVRRASSTLIGPMSASEAVAEAA